MKRLLTTIFGVMCATILWAQSPQAFKYQAVIRNNQGKILVNQLVSLQISILQDNPMGDVVYMETHQVATNDYGIANLTIGGGEVVTGVFADIPWGTNTHFVKTELDITGNRNYEFIGTSQLLSVPYALYAEQAGSANNAVDDFDKDATNELQVLSLEGNMLTLSNGNTIDLGKYLDNTDQQTLSLDNNQLSISGGNTVTIDANNRDEIQALHFSNDTLYLSDGGYVYLGAYWDNTDDQTLSVSGNSLSISGGNSVQFDTDSTNEIQAIRFSNDTLYLSNGGSVYLGSYWDNTDNQTLSIVGNELVISGGNSVILSNNVDLDSDPVNELQILSYSKDTLFLSQGNYVVLPHNNDNDSTNELQVLSRSGNIVSLSLDGGSFSVEDDDSNSTNEIQTLTKTENIISLSDGGSVTLQDDDPINEIQTITLTNDDLTLSKNGGNIDLSGYTHKTEFDSLQANYNELVSLLRNLGMVFQDTTKGIKDGAIINGVFSVGENKKVSFSQGMLYSSGYQEYSFAEEQFSIPNDNLFPWGYNINSIPYQYVTEYSNLQGTEHEWGVSIPVKNGGNTAGLWRTLSQTEWQYLLEERPNAKSLVGPAVINGIEGVVLLPDNWLFTPLGCSEFIPCEQALRISNGGKTLYKTITNYSKEQWYIMQLKGAVFLPNQIHWATESSGHNDYNLLYLMCVNPQGLLDLPESVSALRGSKNISGKNNVYNLSEQLGCLRLVKYVEE